MTRLLSTLIASAAFFIGMAQAGHVYNYTTGNTKQGDGVGQIEFLSVTYEDEGKLSFRTRLGETDTMATGGWMVLTPGDEPGNSTRQAAILYMDFEGGDIYAYRYDGRDGSRSEGRDSFERRRFFITSYEDVLNVTNDAGKKRVEFSELDVSAFGPGTFGRKWTGASFGEYIGAWIHFTAFEKFELTKGGKIKEMIPGLQSWLDFSYRRATKISEVSEPLGFAVLGLFAAGGIVMTRRRRAAKASA